MKTIIAAIAALALMGCYQTTGNWTKANSDMFWGGMALMQSSMPSYNAQAAAGRSMNCYPQYNWSGYGRPKTFSYMNCY